MPVVSGAIQIGNVSVGGGRPRVGNDPLAALGALREIVEQGLVTNETLAALIQGSDPYSSSAFRERLIRHFTAARNAALGQTR